MGEDSFSGFVRSGKSHSVSVSQHTGNAKTTRNNVSSDEHEVEARKTEFEKQSVEDKANIQQVNSEDGQDLRQSVAASNSNATRQKINQGQEVTANLQGIKVENLKENNQKIDTSSTTANLQKAGNANYTTNNQGVANNKPIQDNDQKIPNSGIFKNNQAVNVGAVTSDVQGISKSNIATNKQPLPKGQVVQNKQATKTVVNDENLQPVLNGASLKNDAKAAKLVIEDNNQGLTEQAPDTNHQHLENLALSLNMHRAPKEDVTGANRQPTDKENLNGHFEVLPSEKIERAEVDLGLSVSGRSSELNEIFPKIKIKQQESTSATERLLTAQQAAKLKHDKYVEAFRGRLAGIKRGVDELNGRLDVMEKRK